MALAMAISVYFTSKKRHFPVEPKMPWKLRLKMLVRAIPSLMTVVIIIGGIWGGIFTPTEAAVVACVYALILGTVVYRELTLKDVLKVVKVSLIQSTKTLFIIAVASFLSYFLTHQRIPNQVITGITSITSDPNVQKLIIIFVLLILGCFIEGTAVILIATPVFMPIINSMGMDPIQFGVVMILASMIGLLTPPVGMSLYAVASITEVKVLDLAKAVLPYLLGILLVLLIAAFWPPLSMWLPNLIG